ncbi:hypothetical protein WM23_04615 [Burkholderia ubonensis]|nr:hypothetical protein WM23_04615 [Burkholderia ubonensis]
MSEFAPLDAIASAVFVWNDGSTFVPVEERIVPDAPGAAKLTGLDPSPITTALAVSAFRPVPPLVAPTGDEVVTVTPAMEPPVMFTAFAFWFAIVPAGEPFTPVTVGFGYVPERSPPAGPVGSLATLFSATVI